MPATGIAMSSHSAELVHESTQVARRVRFPQFPRRSPIRGHYDSHAGCDWNFTHFVFESAACAIRLTANLFGPRVLLRRPYFRFFVELHRARMIRHGKVGNRLHVLGPFFELRMDGLQLGELSHHALSKVETVRSLIFVEVAT